MVVYILMKKFFEPRTIAVIGVSRFKGKVGHTIFKNLLKGNQRVYPINPNAKKILGRKAYPSVMEITDKIDLAIIVVPAKIVPEALEECGKKGIKNVIIISSGFSEVGNYELEEKIKEISQTYDIKVIGPNCLGVINPNKNLNASFFGKLPSPGRITFISQSGALGVAILDWAIQNEIGINTFVSIGNGMTSFPELINFFGRDKKTKAICLYVEGLKDGKRFMDSVKNINKPVIVLKGGTTKSGEVAAFTHTASLATEAGIYKGAFKQCGAIQVNTLQQLFMVAEHIVNNKIPNGNKGLIITNAGGGGVLASDAFDRNGLSIPKLPNSVTKKLNELLPKRWSKRNPIDVGGDANPNTYKKVLGVFEKERFYDFILFIVTPQEMTNPEEIAKQIVRFHKRTKVPVFSCFMGGNLVKKAKKIIKENNLLDFDEPTQAAEVISKMIK
jgi:acetyl coenzyme A synthetase (ADP forming)-like protein